MLKVAIGATGGGTYCKDLPLDSNNNARFVASEFFTSGLVLGLDLDLVDHR